MRIGIDFGTTNSVVVIADAQGGAHPVRFEFADHPADDTCRTLLCLWQDHSRHGVTLTQSIGPEAIDAYLDDPAENRLIMSMKTYLAQPSFRETRLFGRTMTLQSLVARFLGELAQKAGLDPAGISATIGRPVRFAGDAADDALGEARLAESFHQAGFANIRIALEPEGAGWGFMRRLTRPATVLVGDFGGGTSDFSVMRFDPTAVRRALPLGHSGVGIAGDQFDFRIIDNVVSPLLGRDSTYQIMGGEPLPVPVEWYSGLSRWHKLSLMRTPQTLRSIADVAKTASEPERLRNLINLIEDQEGQNLYRAIAATKAALSSEQEARLQFSHRNLNIDQIVTRTAFESWIAPDLAMMDRAIDEAMTQSGVALDQIDRVFLTGGTSFVPAVRALFSRRFDEERIDSGSEFVSVAEGLALMELAHEMA